MTTMVMAKTFSRDRETKGDNTSEGAQWRQVKQTNISRWLEQRRQEENNEADSHSVKTRKKARMSRRSGMLCPRLSACTSGLPQPHSFLWPSLCLHAPEIWFIDASATSSLIFARKTLKALRAHVALLFIYLLRQTKPFLCSLGLSSICIFF